MTDTDQTNTIAAPPSGAGTLVTPSGTVPLPTYLPDATRGVVRSLDAKDLEDVGLDMIMVNAFHLGSRPGTRRLQQLGGLHAFTGWNGPISTDSGGFQALSLIRENPKNGSVRKDGLLLRMPERGKVHLTAEKAVANQLRMGTDVVISLDVCTDPNDPPEVQARSVDRTIAWAKKGKQVFDRQIAQRKESGPPPVLVGVIQGGLDDELRTRCAQALMEMGFGAYGFGGWPIDEAGALHLDTFALLHRILPADVPRFALGVGRPEHLVALSRLGGHYVFDCSLPTRDARRHRVFTRTGAPLSSSREWYRYVYLLDEKHGHETGPMDPTCDGICCRRYSRGYLHHLSKIGDATAWRLATIHNLRFYTRLIAELRAERDAVGVEAGGPR